MNLSNFLNPDILKYEVQLKITEQIETSLQLAYQICSKATEKINQLVDHFFRNFPGLSKSIQWFVGQYLDSKLQLSRDEVTKMIKIESGLVYARSGIYEQILEGIDEVCKKSKKSGKPDEL